MSDIEQTVDVVFKKENTTERSDVTVIVSLYNYSDYITDCLESVYSQTEKNLDLIVVDDCSTDDGLQKVKKWMEDKSDRFNRVLLLYHLKNQGLSTTRNTSVYFAGTPYVFVLDADNQLYPTCITKLKIALDENPEAFFAYNIICVQSENNYRLTGYQTWDKELLAAGNYIDAMTLIRKQMLIELGGYAVEMDTGWEDYDLWCRVAERGGYGVMVPQVLSFYREHSQSMLREVSHKTIEKSIALINKIKSRHSWLTIEPE